MDEVLCTAWRQARAQLYGDADARRAAALAGGILVHGAPGTGKTLLAASLAHALHARFLVVNGADIVSDVVGESEARLRRVFADAGNDDGRTLLFLDEVDALCPSRGDASSSSDAALHARLVCALMALLDEVAAGEARVVVMAASNRPDAIDACLRRPGRLGTELHVAVPDVRARAAILRVLLRGGGGGAGETHALLPPSPPPHSLTDDDIERIAKLAHGFVGADLRALLQHAALRALEQRGEDTCSDDNASASVVLSASLVESALSSVRPSGLRELVVEVPRVSLSDVVGLEHVKQRVHEAVEWPLVHAASLARVGVRAPSGLLLYGPPGTGKTLLARAVASSSSVNFVAVKGPELLSKWVGASEKAVRDVFCRARMAAPCIIFFDEIDAIASARASSSSSSGSSSGSSADDRVLSQLLTEMDGVDSSSSSSSSSDGGGGGVVVIAATNRPWCLDAALLRPGRLDRHLYVGPPGRQARSALLYKHMAALPLHAALQCPAALDDILLDRTDGFTGAELVALVRDVATLALDDAVRTGQTDSVVTPTHIDAALREFRARLSPELVEYYASFAARSGVQSSVRCA